MDTDAIQKMLDAACVAMLEQCTTPDMHEGVVIALRHFRPIMVQLNREAERTRATANEASILAKQVEQRMDIAQVNLLLASLPCPRCGHEA